MDLASLLIAAGSVLVMALSLLWTHRKDKRSFQKDNREQAKDLVEQLGGFSVDLITAANARAERAEQSVSAVVEQTRIEIEQRCRDRIDAARREVERDTAARLAEMQRELDDYRVERDMWRRWSMGRGPAPDDTMPPPRRRPRSRDEESP